MWGKNDGQDRQCVGLCQECLDNGGDCTKSSAWVADNNPVPVRKTKIEEQAQMKSFNRNKKNRGG